MRVPPSAESRILGETTGEDAPILWGTEDKESDQKVELCRESPQKAGVMHPPHDNVALVSNGQHGQTALEQKQQNSEPEPELSTTRNVPPVHLAS